jgi:chemotaxis protein MotB
MAELDEMEGPPPPPAKPPVIVIRRKKAAAHGHHGGAWKVAYADFVTAMMALFIVLWLMSSDEDVKKAIASYFNNPTGPGTMTGTAAAGAGHSIDMSKEEMSKLRDKIEQALSVMPKFRELKDNVEMTITADGLRIELLESDNGVFFESGQPRPNPTGQELLTRLAEEVGKLSNGVLIEGHTDSKPFPGEDYSNWELSADRANSARKIMQLHGLRPEQISEVRGYADRHLRHANDPAHPSNRRISLIVQHRHEATARTP